MGLTRRQIVFSIATTAWIMGLLVAFYWLWTFDGTPGSVGNSLSTWPADSTLDRSRVAATLVMAVHPQCACSRASIAELARVVARARAPLRVYVLAVITNEIAVGEWEQTSLLQRARAIPGVQVVSDLQGAEARRFGAMTSGHATLYAADGRLLFSGGITSRRGHEGDNAGEDALLEAVRGQHSSPPFPVFGCSLFSNAAQVDETGILELRD